MFSGTPCIQWWLMGGDWGDVPPGKLRGRPPGKLGDALPPGWKSVGSYYLSLNHGHK